MRLRRLRFFLGPKTCESSGRTALPRRHGSGQPARGIHFSAAQSVAAGPRSSPGDRTCRWPCLPTAFHGVFPHTTRTGPPERQGRRRVTVPTIRDLWHDPGLPSPFLSSFRERRRTPNFLTNRRIHLEPRRNGPRMRARSSCSSERRRASNFCQERVRRPQRSRLMWPPAKPQRNGLPSRGQNLLIFFEGGGADTTGSEPGGSGKPVSCSSRASIAR